MESTGRQRARRVLVALSGLGVLTGAALVVNQAVDSPAGAGWLYLLIVLPVTLRWGRAAGITVACVAGLLLLWLLTEPRFSLDLTSPRDGVRIGLSLGGLILVVLLVDQANRGRIAAECRIAAQAEREQARQLALAGIAHDLSQPLTALLVAAQLLERGYDQGDAERRAETIADLRRAAGRLNRLVSDWLALARGDGPADLALRPVEALAIVEQVAHDYEEQLQRRLVLEHPQSLPPVRADPYALERILDNLLSNAAKYGSGTVTLRVAAADDVVCFSVLDRGPGLPPDAIEHVFKPFVRTEEARARTAGHGLGLAIAAMLVRAQGGTIRAENRPEGGAAFHFTVPIAAAEAAHARPPAASTTVSSTGG
jgi:signal transduction histidine kinase